jgi:hypothetical protein
MLLLGEVYLSDFVTVLKQLHPALRLDLGCEMTAVVQVVAAETTEIRRTW